MLRKLSASVAIVLASFSNGHAQTAVPPTNGPCVVVGTIATCTGNVSTGVVANGPALDTLNINTLTQDITPGAGVGAVNFTTTNSNLTINLDLGRFQAISGAGAFADAVDGTINGDGILNINSSGNLTSSDANGILGFVTGNGNVNIVSVGDISTGLGPGINALVGDSGNVSIDSTGNVTVNGPAFPGFPAFPFSLFGILGGVTNTGDVRIVSNGNVNVSGGAFATGIQVNNFLGAIVPRTATIISNGNITANSAINSIGISAGHDDGNINVSSTGDILADTGITVFTGFSGDLTVNSTGNITALDTGIFVDTPSGIGNIRVDGGVVSGADGIFLNAVSAAPSTISVLAGGTVQGTGTTATDRAIDITGGPLNVLVAGNVVGATGGAIQFAPGAFNDRLELFPGFGITNTVFADAGIDTLRFNGPGNGAFDLSTIDTGTNTQQYRQFELFEVNNGLWTFSNATTASFVANGGTVTGNATFGELTVNNGATLAPGAGQGTMNVNGNLVFNNGAIFAVDLSPDGTSDLVNVTGTTTIAGGGSVLNATLNPLVIPTTQTIWTLINSTGGVTGQFSNVTDNLPDIDLQAVYNPTTVQLVFTPTAVAAAASPKEIHPSSLMAALDSSLLFVETLRRRGNLNTFEFRESPQSEQALGFLPVLKPKNGTQIDFALNQPDWSIWGAVMASDAEVDAERAIPGWEVREDGLAIGLERQFAAGSGYPVTVGVAAGYIQTDVEVGSSGADLESWHIGVYGATVMDRLSLSGAAAYARHDYDFDRILAFGGGTLNADGQADGYSLSGSFEAFYDLSIADDPDTYFGPLGTLGLAHGTRETFTETGAGVLDLSVLEDDAAQAKTGIGIAAGTIREHEDMIIKLDTRIQWEHVFGDTSVTTTSTIPLAAAAFSTPSASTDRDRLGVGFGVGVEFSETASAHMRYNGSFGANSTSHDVSAGFTLRF